MTYETLIDELFTRFPHLACEADDCMFNNDERKEPLNYVIFGCVLLPYLESVLEEGQLDAAAAVCAYLEDAALAARQDVAIANLLGVEIGEWLEGTPLEDRVMSLLGPETKRVCSYVPGLATQRLAMRK